MGNTTKDILLDSKRYFDHGTLGRGFRSYHQNNTL